MRHNLNGLNLLVFAPSFFNYEKEIVKKLEHKGANVVFFDERPSNSTLGKGIVRLSKKISRNMINKYYKKIELELSGKKFDYIIFFQAEATPTWFLKFLNSQYKNQKKILYLWDSVVDKPLSLNNRELYDEIYTFDPIDAKEYGLKFRPLFYSDEYVNEYESTEHKFDFSFIGTVREDRYNIIQNLKKTADIAGNSYFVFYYLQSKWLFHFYKLIYGWFRDSKVNIDDFSFKPLNHFQIKNIISQTNILIDIQKPKQVGLTIRTIELLASKKKFVTTNTEIQKYNFYSINNIDILSRDDPKIRDAFIDLEYEKIDEKIVEQYSLDNFLLEILGLKNTNEYYRY